MQAQCMRLHDLMCLAGWQISRSCNWGHHAALPSPIAFSSAKNYTTQVWFEGYVIVFDAKEPNGRLWIRHWQWQNSHSEIDNLYLWPYTSAHPSAHLCKIQLPVAVAQTRHLAYHPIDSLDFITDFFGSQYISIGLESQFALILQWHVKALQALFSSCQEQPHWWPSDDGLLPNHKDFQPCARNTVEVPKTSKIDILRPSSAVRKSSAACRFPFFLFSDGRLYFQASGGRASIATIAQMQSTILQQLYHNDQSWGFWKRCRKKQRPNNPMQHKD